MRTQLLLSSCTLAVIALTGCSGNAPESEPHPPAPQKTTGKPQNAAQNKNEQASTFEAWGKALTRWAQGEAETAAAKPAAVALPVYVDISALARRHPAWRLADSIENGKAPLAAEALQPARLPQVNIPGRQGAGGNIPDLAIKGATLPRGAQVHTASRVAALHDRAERRQNRSLDAFLRRAGEEQRQEREAKADSLEAGLAENIDAARRPDLPEIDPSIPTDKIQLEMTNLRLLLQNERLPATRRAEAEALLKDREEKWREALRLQEEERVAELARLREETPRRLRAEGEARIARIMEADATRDADLRNAVSSTQKARIENDFRATDRRFGILLPATGADSRRTGGRNEGREGSQTGALRASQPKVPYNLNETFARGLSSTGGGSTRGNGAREAAVLRQRALSEARRWAGVVARRSNWKLQGVKTAGSVDKTPETLRLLNWR